MRKFTLFLSLLFAVAMTTFADDAKWYRLKESTRSEYMNVASFDPDYEQGAYGLVNIAPYAESDAQIFTMEDAGDGKVYLRTKNDYYVTCGSWNVNVSPSAKEALIFEETSVDGVVAYYIHASSQANNGFKIGGVNLGNGSYSEDYYVYCDAPQDLWAKWILEEVAETPVAPTYNVTVSVEDPTMGTATVEYVDGKATFTATANDGYKFVDWLWDGYAIGRGPVFEVNPVEYDINLVAKFEAIGGGETPSPEEPAGFEWASKTEVLVPAEGGYSEILGTMYTLTATVSVEDDASVSAPESFDFGLGYYPGYDDGAGYVVAPYFYVGYVNNQRGGSYYTNMPMEIAEDGKSAVITLTGTYIGSQLYMYDAEGQKTTLTLTLNEDGTISMSDFVVSDMDGFKVATYTNVKLTKKGEEPVAPAELTVTGYTPNAAVTSLETIEITFSDAIATKIPSTSYVECPDGSQQQFLDRIIEGNILRLRIWAQTAEGTYTLTIPGGVIKTADGLEYAGGEFTFTVESIKYLSGEVIEPASNSTVTSLSYIGFTYTSYGIYYSQGVTVNVTDKDGNVVAAEPYFNYTAADGSNLDWNAVGLHFTTPITTPGVYTVTIPEGAIFDQQLGEISPAYTLTYTIEEAAEPEPEPEPSYAYYEGTNNHASRALTSFTIANLDTEVSLNVEDIQAVNAKSPIYVDKTENVLEVAAGNTIYFEEFGFSGEWMHAYAYIDYNNDFTFDTKLNADGTTGGELVSYNHFDGKDSWGNASNQQYANVNDYNGSKGLPHFVLPAELAAGDYRMRIKTDWNLLDANFVGQTSGNNPKTNGACQVDFIIRVVGDEPVTPEPEPEPEPTSIESINANVANVIYDVTGRRVEKISRPGLYIVNGVKVLVK